VPYVITELCIRDGACAEVCPVACIHSTPDAPQFYIDPDICIECEQCVVVCPVDAVFLDSDLPDEYEPSIEVNADFFRENKAPMEQLSLEMAMQMVHAAEAYARRMGHKVSVAVVDGSGTPVAISRMDGAPARTVDLAIGKAYTATVFYLTTDGIGVAARRLAFQSLKVSSRGRIMAAAGGIPIAGGFGAELIGGIGVAGSSTESADALCSRAGATVLDGPGH